MFNEINHHDDDKLTLVTEVLKDLSPRNGHAIKGGPPTGSIVSGDPGKPSVQSVHTLLTDP